MNVNGFSEEVGFEQACKEAGLRLFGQKEQNTQSPEGECLTHLQNSKETGSEKMVRNEVRERAQPDQILPYGPRQGLWVIF